LKAGAVHMRQTTLLYVLRIALYKQALRSAAASQRTDSQLGRDVAKRRRRREHATGAVLRAMAPGDLAGALAAAKQALAEARQLEGPARAAALAPHA
jgi:hypothetical protein